MRKVCGLDVHKDSVFVCVLSETGEKIQDRFGVYWIPVWRLLESDFELKLVNPYFIKQLPFKKSDVKDAERIVTCQLKDLIKGSYVPDELILSVCVNRIVVYLT
jgi:transposase